MKPKTLNQESSLISLLLDTCNQLIAEGMQKIEYDEPEKHQVILEFAAAGATPRITIETHPGLTTTSFTLNHDGGGVHVFQIRTVRAMKSLH
jgi:hypothetical protein